jgi:hypothetical protein
MQIGLVLEEVEMSPRHLFSVVGRAIGSTATRAGEATAGGEVDVDVKPTGYCVEVAPDNRPWRREAQRQLQQAGVTHGILSAIQRLPVGHRLLQQRHGHAQRVSLLRDEILFSPQRTRDAHYCSPPHRSVQIKYRLLQLSRNFTLANMADGHFPPKLTATPAGTPNLHHVRGR